MSLFAKKNYAAVIITFVVGLFAVAGIYGLTHLFRSQSTINGKVAAYLLDGQGKVNGFLLAGGEQLHFSPETGEAVVSVVKIGDDIAATGDAGTKSDYGSAFHVEQLTADGQTFTEIKAPKKPRGEHPKPPRDGKQPRGEKPDERPIPQADGEPTAGEQPKVDEETLNATGAIGAFLVNMHGDIDGLILTGGEQIRFSPKVGEQIASSGASAESQVSAQGVGVKNERGIVIRPNSLTIGSQTFTLGK